MERRLRQGARPPIVILGVLEEDLNRTVNRYRPFYVRHTNVRLGFKPRFYIDSDDEMTLLPNPPRTICTMS